MSHKMVIITHEGTYLPLITTHFREKLMFQHADNSEVFCTKKQVPLALNRRDTVLPF